MMRTAMAHIRQLLSDVVHMLGRHGSLLQDLGFDHDGWQAKRLIASTLAMLCRCDAAIPAAIQANVPAHIVTFAEASLEPTFPADCKEAMQHSCIDAIQQLAHSNEGKAAVRAAGVIPVLANLLHSDNAVTVGKALHGFMGLTIDNESKEPTLEVRSQLVARLNHSAGRTAGPKLGLVKDSACSDD